MPSKKAILKGRKAVDAYRSAHMRLYTQGWHKGIPEEHTPLLNTLMEALNKQGFASLDEFFTASNQLNLEEAGLAGKVNLTADDIKLLDRMWH